uniref:Uncharacterized protein n=1 Tax=Arundo donax TaxID=35708 RepID=A0A0A9TF43_ARUDO
MTLILLCLDQNNSRSRVALTLLVRYRFTLVLMEFLMNMT